MDQFVLRKISEIFFRRIFLCIFGICGKNPLHTYPRERNFFFEFFFLLGPPLLWTNSYLEKFRKFFSEFFYFTYLESADYGLWAVGFGLWAVGYGLWAMGHGLWAMDYGLCNIVNIKKNVEKCSNMSTKMK